MEVLQICDTEFFITGPMKLPLRGATLFIGSGSNGKPSIPPSVFLLDSLTQIRSGRFAKYQLRMKNE